ncbi:transcriptional regulator [Corallococcus terminator]|uniref:Transcriptional regulator n=1 Tax=Corallococcus terminator TaxID=2316733 RepID=A0A3A8J597_9BACT|nr:transcriptional regulator [Corallococcus terminator]RKG87040.1 transcriptional regulator [Corallococcus terminator]
MARGSKAKYSDKQKRMAEHIEEGYEDKGAGEKTAEARAWATVNKLTGGGMKGGSGSKAKVARSRPAARKNARKAGRIGGKRRAAAAKKTSTSSRRKATPTRAKRVTTGRKATRTGTAGKRSTARKSTARKTPARRSPARKSTSRSRTTKRGGSRK